MKKIDIKEELRVHIARKYKNQRAAADAWNVSPGLVSMVLKGDRPPTKSMLADAGFQKVEKPPVYMRLKATP